MIILALCIRLMVFQKLVGYYQDQVTKILFASKVYPLVSHLGEYLPYFLKRYHKAHQFHQYEYKPVHNCWPVQGFYIQKNVFVIDPFQQLSTDQNYQDQYI